MGNSARTPVQSTKRLNDIECAHILFSEYDRAGKDAMTSQIECSGVAIVISGQKTERVSEDEIRKVFSKFQRLSAVQAGEENSIGL